MKRKTADRKYEDHLIPVPITCKPHRKLTCTYYKCEKYFTKGFMLMSSVLGNHFLQRGNDIIGPVTRPWGRPYCSAQCVEDDR